MKIVYRNHLINAFPYVYLFLFLISFAVQFIEIHKSSTIEIQKLEIEKFSDNELTLEDEVKFQDSNFLPYFDCIERFTLIVFQKRKMFFSFSDSYSCFLIDRESPPPKRLCFS
jgi:hypothetical protein